MSSSIEFEKLFEGLAIHPLPDEGPVTAMICVARASSPDEEGVRWVLFESSAVSMEEELGVLRVQHRLLRNELLKEIENVEST